MARALAEICSSSAEAWFRYRRNARFVTSLTVFAAHCELWVPNAAEIWSRSAGASFRHCRDSRFVTSLTVIAARCEP